MDRRHECVHSCQAAFLVHCSSTSDLTSSSSSISTTDLALLGSYPIPASSSYASQPFAPDPDLDPSSTFDAWASTRTFSSVLAAMLLFLRILYHLAASTGGLYLASGVFTALAPLLDSSLAWVPLVLAACAVATIAAPFWGLALSFLARRLIDFALKACRGRASPPPHVQEEEAEWSHADGARHTRRCVFSLILGAGLALLRIAVALLLLTCHAGEGWRGRAWICTRDAFSRDDILAHLSTIVGVTFAPLAAAWFLSWRLKPDPPPTGHYVVLALKSATVVLTLTHIYLTVAVGRQNADLRGEVEMCRLALGGADAVLGKGVGEVMGQVMEQVVVAE